MGACTQLLWVFNGYAVVGVMLRSDEWGPTRPTLGRVLAISSNYPRDLRELVTGRRKVLLKYISNDELQVLDDLTLLKLD